MARAKNPKLTFDPSAVVQQVLDLLEGHKMTAKEALVVLVIACVELTKNVTGGTWKFATTESLRMITALLSRDGTADQLAKLEKDR